MAPKIILDSLKIDPLCYDPNRSPKNGEVCSIQVRGHFPDHYDSQPELNFEWKNGKFTLSANTDGSTLKLLRDNSFNEEDPSLQTALRGASFIHQAYMKSYQSPPPPLFTSLYHFLVSGNLETPDILQRKAMANLLYGVFISTGDSLNDAWLNNYPDGIFSTLDESQSKRLEWVLEEQRLYRRLLAYTQAQDSLTQLKMKTLSSTLLVYIATGRGDLDEIQTSMDELASQLTQASYTEDNPLKDLYKTFYKMLSALGETPFYTQNIEAKTSLTTLLDFLQNASRDHRVELVKNPDAFRRSLAIRIENAERSQTLIPLTPEFEKAQIQPRWFSTLQGTSTPLEQIEAAILPFLDLPPQREGEDPEVIVHFSKIQEATQTLIQKNKTDEREYKIGILAVLKHLFGENFNNTSIEAWVKSKFTRVHLHLSKEEAHALAQYGKDLQEEINTSIYQTEITLGWWELGGLAAGGGLVAAGFALPKEGALGTVGDASIVAGSIIGTAGLSALICHFTVASQNPFITELFYCGGIGVGAGAGVGIGLLQLRQIPTYIKPSTSPAPGFDMTSNGPEPGSGL